MNDFMERAAETLGVNFPERTIDLIVIPYDSEALVPYQELMGARPRNAPQNVFERIRAGAFDGIEKRANRIRVNREHKRELTMGKALTFRPDDPRGLFARVKISQTPLGDEALQLAADDNLEASAAFAPLPGGSRWIDRDHIEHTKCWLKHIALTADGAYGADAPVLAVRAAGGTVIADPPAAPGPTPNLDIVRARILAQRYDLLSR